MTFWDSSVLVPLVLEEARSASCRAALKRHRAVVTGRLTETELLAAIWRRHLAPSETRPKLTSDQALEAERRLERIARSWEAVWDIDSIQSRAREVVRVHALKASDALQLAAARLWAGADRKNCTFVCADGPLARAAAQDGFRVERIL